MDTLLENLKDLDKNPAVGLWAPGGYLKNCSSCRLYFAGDKRASHCGECAEMIFAGEIKRYLKDLGPKEAKRFMQRVKDAD